MAVNNSTATLTQEMAVFYDKLFLERLQAETCYDFLTSKRSIPKNSGKVVYLTRQTAFTPSTTALTEGTTPSAVAFSAATVSATVAGYGEYTTFSDLFSMTGIDAGLKEKVSTFGQFMAEKMDTVRLYKMVAGATVQYANDKYNSALSTPLSTLLSTDTLDVADVRKVVLTLKKNKAPKFDAPVGSLNKGGAYRGVLSSQGYYDLLGDSGTGAFTAINVATSDALANQVKAQEIKRIAGVDIMESNLMYTEASAGAGAATDLAYSNLFCGKDAVLEIDVAGSGNPHIDIKMAEQSVADPLAQINVLSAKVDAWDCVVANSDWLINKKSYGV
jgi:N4-gp56 family major capsid protein